LICIYIYIYIYRERERERERALKVVDYSVCPFSFLTFLTENGAIDVTVIVDS